MKTVLRIVTDTGDYTPTPTEKWILESAKLRKDGQPDLRTLAGRVARGMIDSVLLRSRPRI